MAEPVKTKRIFDHDELRGSFSAYDDAVAWVVSLGYSVGQIQRGAPTLIFYGDCEVAKFRNISSSDRRSAAGSIIGVAGRFRDGPVTVEIKNIRPVAAPPPSTVPMQKSEQP